MGAFFGSLHVRSDDIAGVQRVLEVLAASKKDVRFLVRPATNGWISVYPSGHGQDPSVGVAIAEGVQAPTLHLLLHHDDVFAYYLYALGGLVDEYCSDPDYFEEASGARREATAGRPETLAALVAKDAGAFAAALDRDAGKDDVFRPRWQISNVAELLGIENVETSYEYLREGETRGVKGWKQFVHVPDLAAEKEEARRHRAEITSETKRLQREGRLLLVQSRKTRNRYGFAPRPVSCTHRSGGFLVGWSEVTPGETAVERWGPSWDKAADEVVRVDARMHRMQSSACGRFLGIGYAAGDWSARVFDIADRRLLATVPLRSAADDLSFSADGQTMVCRSQDEVVLASTSNGHSIRRLEVGNGRSVALHPDSRWLVSGFQDRQYRAGVAVFNLDEDQATRVLATARHDFQRWLEARGDEATETGFHPHETPNRMGFTSDGRLLVVVMMEGVRVYSWDEVLKSESELPTPLATASTDVVRTGTSVLRNTYAFAVDTAGRVLFAGLDGLVRALDVGSGRASTVLEAPDRPAIIDMALAADGKALAIGTQPDMFERGQKKRPPAWQVWSLEGI